MNSQQSNEDLERRKTEAEVKLLEDQIKKNADKEGCSAGCGTGLIIGLVLVSLVMWIDILNSFTSTLILVISILVALIVYAKVSK